MNAVSACKKAEETPKAPPAPTATKEPAAATPVTNPLVGTPAPDFTLKDLDGKEVALASLKGKPVTTPATKPYGCSVKYAS